METTTIGPVKKRIRIWIPDVIGKNGGSWVYGTLHDVCVNIDNVIVFDNQVIDIEDTLEMYDDCLIEEIKN